MSQNPYAHTEPTDLGGGYDELPMTPTRTSALAITSLVFAIIAIPGCCMVGLGVVPGLLAVLLGIVALLAISSSGGRLGGRGLAISGVIIGLVFSAFSIAVLFGGSYFTGEFAAFQRVVERAQQNDPDAVRGYLSTGSSAMLTDEEINAFGLEVSLVIGNAAPSTGVLDFIGDYTNGDPMLLQNVQMVINTHYPPPDSAMPMPISGDSADSFMIVVLDQYEQRAAGVPTARNIGVVDPATDEVIWLIDPSEGP